MAAVRLLGDLYQVAGMQLTHPWDGSAYLILGPEPVLLDCGSSLGYEQMAEQLASLGLKPGDIRGVFGTHGHWDHLTGLDSLRRHADIPLYLHAGDREGVESGDPDRTAAFLYDLPFPPLRVDHELTDGQVLALSPYAVTVIHTPGHTPGSVCFLVDIAGTRVLIAGDTVEGGYHPRIRSDLGDWKRSLDRLIDLDFDALSTGHRPPVLTRDPKPLLRRYQRRFGQLLNPWFALEDTAPVLAS
jgi:glyoxylase-like metal-dependent hydrolase (beta-lactamase superfamily II)